MITYRQWNMKKLKKQHKNVSVKRLTHLVSSGLSLSIVGKFLRHTQASTTQRYAHLADEPLRKATAVFGDKLTMLTKTS